MDKRKREFRFHPRSLRATLAVFYFTMMILTIGLLSFVFTDTQAELISENARLQAKDLIHKIVAGLKKSLDAQPGAVRDTTGSRIQRIRALIGPFIENYAVTDDQGRIVFHKGTGEKLPKDFSRNVLKARRFQSYAATGYFFNVVPEKHIMQFYVPLEPYGLSGHILYIPVYLKNVSTHFNGLYRSLFFMIILITGTHFVIAIFVFRSVIRPLFQMIAATQKIAGGDYSVRIDLHRQDEMNELAMGLNTMAGEIQNKINSLNAQMAQTERAKKRLEQLAISDELSGLYNRRFFHQSLDQQIRSHLINKNNLTLIIMDIDNFKTINDTWGHLVGDEVIKCVSSCIQADCRKTDLVSRYGGDELVVLLPHATLAGGKKIAEKMKASIADPKIEVETGTFLKLTASMGISSLSLLDGNDPVKLAHDLLSTADQALYLAKNRGKNRIVCHRGKKDPRAPGRDNRKSP